MNWYSLDSVQRHSKTHHSSDEKSNTMAEKKRCGQLSRRRFRTCLRAGSQTRTCLRKKGQSEKVCRFLGTNHSHTRKISTRLFLSHNCISVLMGSPALKGRKESSFVTLPFLIQRSGLNSSGSSKYFGSLHGKQRRLTMLGQLKLEPQPSFIVINCVPFFVHMDETKHQFKTLWNLYNVARIRKVQNPSGKRSDLWTANWLTNTMVFFGMLYPLTTVSFTAHLGTPKGATQQSYSRDAVTQIGSETNEFHRFVFSTCTNKTINTSTKSVFCTHQYSTTFAPPGWQILSAGG